MKHQTINVVKFKALSKRLKLPLCWTVGILEGIWLFACHNARDGDLSRFSDLELAGWLEYPGDERELIQALVETRWLDRVGERLLIHDWDEHKPNWLKGIQGRSEKEKPSCEPSCVPSELPSSEPSSTPSTEPPNLTLPKTKPNQTTTLPFDPEPLPAAWQAVVGECEKLGMDQPGQACEVARSRGCLAAEAMAQVDHFKAHPGAWGIGLLYSVIKNLRPEKRVQWPDPSPEFVARQKREQEQQARAAAMSRNRNDRAETVKQREQFASEVEQLEKEFGAALDAMKKDEQRQLTSRVCPVMINLLPKRGRIESPLLRFNLLKAISTGQHELELKKAK